MSDEKLPPLRDVPGPVISEYDKTCIGHFTQSLGSLIGCIGTYASFGFYSPYHFVPTNTEALIFRRDQMVRKVGAGAFYLNPVTEGLHLIPLSPFRSDIQSRSFYTKDRVGMDTKVSVIWHVFDSVLYYYNKGIVEKTLQGATEEVVRALIATMDCVDAINMKAHVSADILCNIRRRMWEYGIHVDNFVIRDVDPPSNYIQQLASDSSETRKAHAKEIETAMKIKLAMMQAESEANVRKRRAESRGEAIRIFAEAQAKASAIQAEAEAKNAIMNRQHIDTLGGIDAACRYTTANALHSHASKIVVFTSGHVASTAAEHSQATQLLNSPPKHNGNGNGSNGNGSSNGNGNGYERVD